MSSTPPEIALNRSTALLRSTLCILIFILTLLSLPSHAQQAGLVIPPAAESQEAWLVTYAPGELYWQRYGHNAIWLREPARGIDHAFNFGYFDFEQENFFLNFARGRMLYYSLAIPVEREFEQYRRENRSIIAQKLELGPDAFAHLRDHLLEQIQPENRNYLYHYYLSNCSTRVRDILDMALDGRLAAATGSAPAMQNFRDHTRRSIVMDPGYYLGLEMVLGLPVDREVTRWDEMFLPSVLAESLSRLQKDGGPAVSSRIVLFEGGPDPTPAEPPAVWWQYLLFSIALAGLVVLTRLLPNTVLFEGLGLAWLLLAANGGVILLMLWGLTDHRVANPNINLLLLNPLFVLAFRPALRRLVAWLIIVGLVIAAGQLLLPMHQFNADVLAFMAPLHAVFAWWLWKKPRTS